MWPDGHCRFVSYLSHVVVVCIDHNVFPVSSLKCSHMYLLNDALHLCTVQLFNHCIYYLTQVGPLHMDTPDFTMDALKPDLFCT